MRDFRLRLAAALLPLAAGGAWAQPQPAPQPQAQAGAAQQPAWQVDWGEENCSLIRLPGRGTPYAIALRMLPGSDWGAMFVSDRGFSIPPASVDGVALAPSGRTFALYNGNVETRIFGVHRYYGLPPEFWEVLGGSNALQLRHGARTMGEVALTQTAAAVRMLQQCISHRLQDWGIDEAAWRAQGRHPAALNRLGIDDRDYPSQAIDRSLEGRVIVRVNIDAEGRPTACAPVVSSNVRPMDNAACHAAMTRGRFVPALDAAGAPTAAQYVTSIMFLMRR